MKSYFRRLAHHPGLPVLIFMTLAMIGAGMQNETMTLMQGVLIGLVAISPFWVIVLWTARTQPLPDDDQ